MEVGEARVSFVSDWIHGAKEEIGFVPEFLMGLGGPK